MFSIPDLACYTETKVRRFFCLLSFLQTVQCHLNLFLQNMMKIGSRISQEVRLIFIRYPPELFLANWQDKDLN